MRACGYVVAMCTGLAAMLTVSVGCMSNTESAVADVSPKGWRDPAGMVYANRDTVSERSPALFLRHDQRTGSGEYAVEFRAPSGRVSLCDTVSVKTSDSDGYYISVPPTISISTSMNWKSSRLGRLRLEEEGDYTVTVTPLQTTTGVWSVGVVLNSSKQNGQR